MSIPVQGFVPQHPIPTEWAEYLCEEICESGAKQGFSLTRIYCWFSHLFTHEPVQACYCRKEGNHGCPLVNSRDNHYYWAFHKT